MTFEGRAGYEALRTARVTAAFGGLHSFFAPIRSRRALGGLSLCLAGLALCALCPPALADPISIFGVAVYIVERPACPGGDAGRDVRAQASPFDEQPKLGDIVLELA